MSCIAVIPARGGSKRIPRKNIRNFDGIPILGRTIRELKNSKLFKKIYVSTEDFEIAEVAKKYGAEIIDRFEEFANDFATTTEVMRDVVFSHADKIEIDSLLCCVYPVNPFLDSTHIAEAIKMITEQDLDFVFTAKLFESPIERALTLDTEGFSVFSDSRFQDYRTQDLQEKFFDAAMFYLGKADKWANCQSPLSGKSKFILLDKFETIDIDNEIDWIYAEQLYRIKKGTQIF